jgi:hypothetical protein
MCAGNCRAAAGFCAVQTGAAMRARGGWLPWWMSVNPSDHAAVEKVAAAKPHMTKMTPLDTSAKVVRAAT